MTATRARSMRIPGTDAELILRRSGDSETLMAGGRLYLLRTERTCDYDNGFVRTVDVCMNRILLRHVHTEFGSWCEEFEMDEEGRTFVVDGVRITRDAKGRVVECAGESGVWHYAFENDRLTHITTPADKRNIAWSADRPADIRSVNKPNNIHRDVFGRVWTETDANGNVVRTWLWDGFFCFGRIDGPPGDDMAAYFSLDPTGTPVRVVTRSTCTIIPRDAFGESLLEHTGIPGLFGGYVRDGCVHFLGRSLAPRIGSFTEPDPCDGSSRDPRRENGYDGELYVETAYGEYAVCRNDPVGRADPTGMISWGVILSDLTWSMQNNTLGIFGLELTINFWGSLLTVCWLDRSQGFFKFPEFETGKRQATWAMVRRGLLSQEPRAWTFQHILYDNPKDLDSLLITRALSLANPFTPTYYGSVIRFTPASATPQFLIADPAVASASPTLLNWTRAGGQAEAVFAGSTFPRFPSGALHLDNAITDLRPGITGNVVEMAPAGGLGVGTMQQRPRIVLTGTGLGITAGRLLFLTNDARQAEIIPALGADEAGGTTSVFLANMPAVVGTTNLRVRSLEPTAVSTEQLPQGPSAELLNLAGSAAPLPRPDYELNDPLRFTQGAASLGAGSIRAFEVRLQLDEPLPDLGTGAQVLPTSPGPGGNGEVAGGGTQLRITSGAPPAFGLPVLVQAGAQSRARLVTNVDTGDPALIPLDRNLDLGADATPVTWTLLVTSLIPLNAAGAAPVAANNTLTYTPTLERTGPAVGRAIAIVDGATTLMQVVTVVIGDLIVLETNIAGAGDITVERMRFVPSGTPGGVDQSGVTASQALTVALNTPVNVAGDLVRLAGTNAPNVAVAPSANYTNYVATDRASANITFVAAPPRPIVPGVPVLLSNGATTEFALIRALRTVLTLDRRIAAFNNVNNLEIVALVISGPAWNANRLGDLQVAVLPTIGALNWQLPRFTAGQFVQLAFTGGPQFYRVAAVEANGSTLTLSEGPALPDPALNLTVQLLDVGWQMLGAVINTNPIRPVDPNTGGNRLGIRGSCVDATDAAGNPISVLTVDVWRNNSVPNTTVLAIFSANEVHIARVNAAPAFQVGFTAEPAITAPPGGAVSITVANTTLFGFSTQNRMESSNGVLVILDATAPIAPAANNLVFTIPFQAVGNAIDVTTSSGTTLVPDDLSFEFERRQSLVDHELTHTQQCAMWGPMLFCWFPMWAFHVPVELRTDVELPKFSPYVPAKVSENDQGRFLTIGENPRNVEFETGDVLQVTRQLARRSIVNLVERESPGRFRVEKAEGDDPDIGPVITSPVTQEGSSSVGAMLSKDGVQFKLDIADAGGLDFQEGGQAVLLNGDPLGALQLGTRDQNDAKRFVIREGTTVAVDTTVMVRRENSTHPNWQKFFDIMYFLTGGGLTKFALSHTWGRALYYIFKLIYGGGSALFGSDPKQFAATVAGTTHTDLQFADNTIPRDLKVATHVEVISEGKTVVRRVTDKTAGTMTLSAALPFRDEVKVRVYTTTNEASVWDWKSYFPAIVPDFQQPNAIRIEAVGSDVPSLNTFDRLLLQSDNRSTTTRVVSIVDGLIQLEDPAPFSGPERRLLVAFLNADASGAGPQGSALADTFLNPDRSFGMKSWVRIVTDPWGEVPGRLLGDGDVAKWINRSGRWLFGSHSWSLLPIPGWYFWDNMFKQLREEGHKSQMEQEASASSGDLYAPMSRFHPSGRTHFVGDVSRMWFWPWGDRASVTTIAGSRRDAPGVHFVQGVWPIVLPSVTAEINTTPVNRGAATVANAGNQVPDALTFRNFTAALDAPIGAVGPAAYLPTPTAFIPVSQKLERVIGTYVAFTTPGTHRVTVQDSINDATEAREQHEGGESFFINFSQPILFNVTVADVTVTINGLTIANGDTLTLVATQRATVAVQPNNARQYAIGMVQSETGPVLRTDTNTRMTAFGVGVNQPVEISRVHRSNSPDLAEHGMHLLTGEMHVPVRNFLVNVVDTIPLRSPLPDTATLLADVLNANAIASIRVGEEAFLIVPTEVLLDAVVETVNGQPPAPDSPTITTNAPPDIPAGMDVFLGTGAVISVTFASPVTPLPAAVDVRLRLHVGRANNEADLHIDVRLEP